MAEKSLRRTLRVSPNRVHTGRERPYGGEAVQKLRSMVEQLQTRAGTENAELLQQEGPGSSNPAVRSVWSSFSRYRSDVASMDEIKSMLNQHRKVVDQLREEATFYETQLERIKGCKGSVNTVAEDNEEQPVEQLPRPQSRPSCQKEEVDTDGGGTIGLVVNQPCHESLLGSTNREMVTVCQDKSQSDRRQVYGRNRSEWPEARAIFMLQRERDDLLELCSALQTTLARFHGQQLEGQARIKRAQHAVETSTFAKEQMEKNQKDLLKQIEKLNSAHLEDLSCLQEKYESKQHQILEEQKAEVARLSEAAAESQETVDCLKLQLAKSSKELDLEKDRITQVEEMRRQESEELHRQLSKIQFEQKQEIERRDANIEEVAHSAQVRDKQQQVLEEKFKILQHRVQRYERDCATAQDKSCALQELVGDLQRKIAETERQNVTMQQSLAVAEEEKKELERTVHQLQLQMHQTKIEAGDSLDELRGLVEEQKELTGKWKRECELLANQMKETSTRLQQQRQRESSALREEIDSLEKKLAESQSQCVRHGAVHREMQQLLRETDQRAVTSQKQVLALLARQKNLLEERQSLCIRLDQLHNVLEYKDYESLPS